MKKLILLLAFIVATSATQPNVDYRVRIKYGPYVQAVTDTSFTVVWKTDKDAVGWVEVAPDDGTTFLAYSRPVFYESRLGMHPISQWHTVTVTGLEKGKSYRYRLDNKAVIVNNWEYEVVFGKTYGTDVYRHTPPTVTTLDPDKEDVKIWVFQDIHSRDSIFRLNCRGISEDKPDFVVVNGDLSNNLKDEALLMNGYIQTAVKEFASSIPMFHTRGNHDCRGILAQKYLDYFPTTTGKPYYGFRHGPAYFLMLDDGEDKVDDHVEYFGLADFRKYREEEALWLKEVVNSKEFKESPVKIVFMHIPPMVKGLHGDMHPTELFVPILKEAGIDLMVCGHLHNYSLYMPDDYGYGFPLVINGMNEVMRLNVTEKGFSYDVYDTSGKVEHHYEKK